MTLFHNPALRQEPKSKPLTVLSYVSRETLLEWLERTGKLKPHEMNESSDQKLPEDLEILEDLEANLEPQS
jgi:hypothetical protein